MSRSYTSRTILDGGQVKEEDFNSEIQTPLQELNGQLDGNQLPLHSVGHNNLKQPTTSTQYINNDGTYSTYMTTQSYHQSEWLADDITMLYDNSLYTGFSWIRLQDLEVQALGTNVGTGGAEIIFNALEGMIAGCAVIDFNWFSGEAESQTFNPPITARSLFGRDSVIEWGVFVDDVLVSKSGYIWPRRLTLNLPFNTPISSKAVRIDVRFRVQFLDPNAYQTATEIQKSTIISPQSLQLKGAVLWARNQYR